MKKLKKPLALLLSVLLLLSAMPLTAFADEAEPTDTVTVDEMAPTPEATLAPEATAIPEPSSEPEATATPEPGSEPETTAIPEPGSESEATAIPEPSSEPEATPTPEPGSEPEITATPEASATPKPTEEPSPTPDPIPDPVKLEYEVLSDYETDGLFLFPVPRASEITQEYSGDHPAWDIAANEGSPVVAAADGVVTSIQIWDGETTGSMSYGHMVQIRHGHELTTLYAHLSEINVSVGDTVVRGQRIGRVGSTGNATGPHLHLEFITSQGEKINPDWLLAYGVMPLLSPDLPYSTIKEWCNHPNGTRTISDFGVTREEVVAELSAHENDNYYLGTPYQGFDWQSPNGDPSYNGGTAKMNCGGFVAYVLDKCGLNSGTSSIWTHSASPSGSVQWYMTQDGAETGGAWWDWNGTDAVHDRMLMCGAANYPLWIRNADLVAYTYETKAAMLASGVLEKGDIIIMVPKTASSNGFNDSHIGFFWGNNPSEDKMWHSSHPGNNQISAINAKTSNSSYIVMKYDNAPTLYDITLTKTSANVKITNGNSNYSLAGAVYNVYKDKHISGYDYSKDTPVATFTTDASGKANLSTKLQDGDYVSLEETAPKGYVLDKTVHYITINGGNTTMHVVDDPGVIMLTINKKDSGTNTNIAAGNASLAGAVYRVSYQENGKTVSKDITTNAQGIAGLGQIPISTVTVQEIEAPVGYKLDSTVHTYQITGQQVTQAVFELEPADFTEEVIMGKIQLHKQYEVLNGNPADEQGAEFQVYLKSAGSYAAAKASERDTITTSASGYAVTKDLPYGTYIVHQTKGGAGRRFVKDFEVVISADGRTYSYELTNTLKDGQFRIVKTSDDGRVEGFQFRVTRLADNYSKVYTTDASGLILTETLPIYEDNAGTVMYQYRIEELDTEETFGYALPDPQTVTLTDGSIAEVKFCNASLKIGTTAKFEDGTKATQSAEDIVLVDTVSCSGLQIGKEYRMSGVLMDKATGKPFLDFDGNEVTAETTFTPETRDGTVDITFKFNSLNLRQDTDVVVFETLYREGIELTTHADINDGGQTVKIRVPEIGTTATSEDDHRVDPLGEVTITDEVSYENLKPGKEYTVSGVLMDKATGEVFLDAAGQEIRSEVIFTPEEPTGTVTVEFVFDATGLHGKKIVAFEDLYYDGIELATHAEINDEGQTVELKNPQISTVAVTEDGSKTTLTADDVEITDTISYSDLTAGVEYRMTGILMDKATGKPFLDFDGNEVTAEAVFVPDENTPDGTDPDGDPDKPDTDMQGDTETDIGTGDATLDQSEGSDNAADNSNTGSDESEKPSETPEEGNDPSDTEGGTEDAEKGVSGSVELTFTFSSLQLHEDTELVVYDELYRVETDTLIAEHKDMDAEDQTVKVVVPEIGTTAQFEDGGKEIIANKEIVIVDTVAYENLRPGREYTVSGILMDKATGEPFLDTNGHEVTAETVFTPEQPTGTVNVTFRFNAAYLHTQTEIAVFENLYHDGVELTTHADIEDEGQTVTVHPLHGSITTTKVNLEDPTDKISGAVFSVYEDTNANGMYDEGTDLPVGMLDETETGVYRLDGLLYGQFFLHEDTAPEGFVQDIIYYPFQITEDGQIVVFETTPGAMFPNKPIRGAVTTTKVNANDPNDKLSGAVFGVYLDVDKDGLYTAGVDTRVGSMTEGKKGVYTLENLLYNHYLIHEDEAPQGFTQDDNYYPFQIVEDGQTVVFETTPGAMFPNKPVEVPPKTGDVRTLWPWLSAAGIALAGVTVSVLVRRRKQSEGK